MDGQPAAAGRRAACIDHRDSSAVWLTAMVSENKNHSQLPDGQPYRAFLVRCWQEEGSWRFSIETVGRQQQRRGFSVFQELFDYLERILAGMDDDISGPGQELTNDPSR